MQSLRNQWSGKVIEITTDKVVSEVLVQTAVGTITSIITTGSVRAMKLKKGDIVTVRVKSTDVSLEK